MENKQYLMEEDMRLKDHSPTFGGHALRGVIEISRRNKETGETVFCERSENTVTISGYSWIFMKMFNLFLDSSHGKITDNLTRDTTLATPDLNDKDNIGARSSDYTVMSENIPSSHFCQGFVVGNGGSDEDIVTTKNTSYSYVSLRKMIPFQKVNSGTGLNSSIAGSYLGLYNEHPGTAVKSAYIKKFDETPHIYHSWWVDGQKWDYLDKVTDGYLGPDSKIGAPKTNRIETYVECKLSISDTDFVTHFETDGRNETAMINELGLVAYDAIPGERSILETCYTQMIEPFLKLLYSYDWEDKSGTQPDEGMWKACDMIMVYLDQIVEVLDTDISGVTIESKLSDQECLKKFCRDTKAAYNKLHPTDDDPENVVDVHAVLAELRKTYDIVEDNTSPMSIEVEAYYNQNGTLQYVTDNFLQCLKDVATSGLTIDEAQRIKLITYYTFNSIPIDTNWEILINYRIYAN